VESVADQLSIRTVITYTFTKTDSYLVKGSVFILSVRLVTHFCSSPEPTLCPVS